MKRGKELIGNTIIIAIGNLSTKILSFLLLPLYTTILTTTEYGTFDFLTTIATFLVPVITLLMEESMFRFLIDCKNDEEKEEVITQAMIYCVMSALIYIVVIIFIGMFIDIPYMWLFVLHLISSIILSLRNAIARGLSEIKLFSLSNFLTGGIMLTLNYVFIAIFRIGVTGLLLSGIIAYIITSAYVFMKLKIHKYLSMKKLNLKKLKEMLKYSIPLVPNSISWGVINLSDRLIVTSAIDASANGIYSMSYKFPTIMDTIYGFFYTSWKESSAKTVNDKDSIEFYNKVYYTLKKFMWSITLGIIAIMPFIFNLLIKENFKEAYLYIPILMIAMYFNNMSGFYGGIFSAYKNTKIMGITTIIGAIINVVVNILLIEKMGLWAAAISTLTATFTVHFWRKVVIKKYILLKEENKIDFMNILMLVFTIIAYYSKSTTTRITLLILVTIYCIIMNIEIVKVVINALKNKITKNNA